MPNIIITLDNILVIFSMQLAIVTFFTILSLKNLKSKEDQLNLYFFRFFKTIMFSNISMILFFIFLIIDLFDIIIILFYITSVFFYSYAFPYLNIVNNIIIKSTITYTKPQISNYLRFYGISLLLGMILITILLYNITLESTNIVCNVYFFLFMFSTIFIFFFSIIPLCITVNEIYSAIKSKELKKHFRHFYFGIFGLLIVLLLELLSIFVLLYILKIIIYIVVLSSLYWFYLIYKSLSRRLK